MREIEETMEWLLGPIPAHLSAARQAQLRERRRVGREKKEEELALWELIMGLTCRDMKTGAWFHGDRDTKVDLYIRDPEELNRVDHDDEEQVLSWLRERNLSLRELRLICGAAEIHVSPQNLIDSCEEALRGGHHTAALVLPSLWFPPKQRPCIELVDTTRDLLVALREEEKGLADLTWQQLEAVVAELLRERGLEVTATPMGADGGRDIIARGELIPGEPTALAVEVKKKEVVGLDEVRSRLYANRQFPALLFATSGRFTAGVVRERGESGAFLRLLLKDGVALGQWIHEYRAPQSPAPTGPRQPSPRNPGR